MVTINHFVLDENVLTNIKYNFAFSNMSSSKRRALVTKAFSPQSELDIELITGDHVEIEFELDADWFVGISPRGYHGKFPSSCVIALPEKKRKFSDQNELTSNKICKNESNRIDTSPDSNCSISSMSDN